MAPRLESLAGLAKGLLSLKDFEWELPMRPSPFPTPAAGGHPLDSIPAIDLQVLYTDAPHRDDPLRQLVAAISQAACNIGFFQVYNHGISLSALDSLRTYARRFFALPYERKYECAEHVEHPAAGPSGYSSGSPLDSRNKWWTEALRLDASNKQYILAIAKCLCSDEPEQQAFSEILEECSSGFAKLAKDLTVVLLEGLSLNGHDIVEKNIVGEIAGLKMSHYPACPQPNMTLGLPPHSDISILTLLWQDLVGGLEVCINKQWIPITPRHDALVVNIGDILQIWSNDHYMSGLHRVVVNAQESRYSTAYFYYSGTDQVLTPIEELLQKTKQNSKFHSTLMSEHRNYTYSQTFERGSKGVGYLKIQN